MCQWNPGKAGQRALNKFAFQECLEEPRHIGLNKDPASNGIGVSSGYIRLWRMDQEKCRRNTKLCLRQILRYNGWPKRQINGFWKQQEWTEVYLLQWSTEHCHTLATSWDGRVIVWKRKLSKEPSQVHAHVADQRRLGSTTLHRGLVCHYTSYWKEQ